ncbi:hypothetical protein EDD21DRAFT_364355 [Dissophora ornata]|nr:hypothetical protein EDD21DRAFT_364355 [Dissophora ornata]
MEEHQRANDGNQQLRKVQERSKRLVKKKVQKLLGTVAPGVVIISKGDRRKKHGQGEDDSSTDTGSEESTSEESETSSESDSSAIDEEEYEKRQCKRAEDMAAELDAEAEYYDRGGRQGERIPMRPRTESDQSRRTPAQHIGGQRQHSTTGSESPSTVGTSSGGVEDRRESLGRRGVNEITVMDKYRLLQRSMSDTTAEETQKSLPQLPPVMHATSSVRMQPLAPQAASEMAPVSSLPAMIAQSMQALDEQLNQELAAVSSKLRTQTPHVVVAPSAPVIPDVIGIHIDNNNEQKRTKARLVFGSWSKEIF